MRRYYPRRDETFAERSKEVVASAGLLRPRDGGLRRRSERRDDLLEDVVPFRSTDPPKDAPLFSPPAG